MSAKLPYCSKYADEVPEWYRYKRYDKERKAYMERKEKDRKMIYIFGWSLLAAAVCYELFKEMTGKSLSGLGLPCVFRSVTKFYCPGCGGTRAAEYLLSGNIIKSIYYHPLVGYTAAIYIWYMISTTIEYAAKGKYKIGMRYKNSYVIFAVIIILLNFIIKNGAMLFWHYSMIP